MTKRFRELQDELGGEPLVYLVTQKSEEEQCNVLRGELCGGFGVDPDRNGAIQPEQTDAERYHRVREGTISFSELRTERWRASFDLNIDADENEPTILGGRLRGCLDARLEPERGGDTRFD